MYLTAEAASIVVPTVEPKDKKVQRKLVDRKTRQEEKVKEELDKARMKKRVSTGVYLSKNFSKIMLSILSLRMKDNSESV